MALTDYVPGWQGMKEWYRGIRDTGRIRELEAAADERRRTLESYQPSPYDQKPVVAAVAAAYRTLQDEEPTVVRAALTQLAHRSDVHREGASHVWDLTRTGAVSDPSWYVPQDQRRYDWAQYVRIEATQQSIAAHHRDIPAYRLTNPRRNFETFDTSANVLSRPEASDQAITTSAAALQRSGRRLDWWYDYSDDSAVRLAGGRSISRFMDRWEDFASRSPQHAEAASAVWDRVAPKEWRPPAGYVPDGRRTQSWGPAIERVAAQQDTWAQAKDYWQAKASHSSGQAMRARAPRQRL